MYTSWFSPNRATFPTHLSIITLCEDDRWRIPLPRNFFSLLSLPPPYAKISFLASCSRTWWSLLTAVTTRVLDTHVFQVMLKILLLVSLVGRPKVSPDIRYLCIFTRYGATRTHVKCTLSEIFFIYCLKFATIRYNVSKLNVIWNGMHSCMCLHVLGGISFVFWDTEETVQEISLV
jgi:hypothetical protein